MIGKALTKTGPKRVLVTGLSTYWGGRLARAMEKDPTIEVIIGVDNRDPRCELERTEFVRVSNQHSLIRRIVEAAEIDTVVDSRLVVDSLTTSPKLAHENNVMGTMNILAACSRSSPVRKFVFKSSAHYYGLSERDPAFFSEVMTRRNQPRTPIKRDIVEAEAAVKEFAEHNPKVAVSIVRFTSVLGPGADTSHKGLLSLPAIPCIFGYDPRYQFIHEDDVVSVLEHMVQNDLHGIFNAAADGVLALSEVAALLDKRLLPVMPPYGTVTALAPLRRLGVRIPLEVLHQLRYGRGLDNRKLKATGYRFQHTTKECVQRLAEHFRLTRIVKGKQEPYRYEREVEEFLRWSPSVRRRGLGTAGQEKLFV